MRTLEAGIGQDWPRSNLFCGHGDLSILLYFAKHCLVGNIYEKYQIKRFLFLRNHLEPVGNRWKQVGASPKDFFKDKIIKDKIAVFVKQLFKHFEFEKCFYFMAWSTSSSVVAAKKLFVLYVLDYMCAYMCFWNYIRHRQNRWIPDNVYLANHFCLMLTICHSL